jgi:hypothetical protein
MDRHYLNSAMLSTYITETEKTAAFGFYFHQFAFTPFNLNDRDQEAPMEALA